MPLLPIANRRTATRHAMIVTYLLRRLAVIVLLALASLPLGTPAVAQAGAKAPATDTAPVDPFGRSTPRGMASRLLRELGSADYAGAGRYLDVSFVAPAQRAAAQTSYARRLKVLLDRGGRIAPLTTLSDKPAGRPNDDLDANEDVIGSVPARAGGSVPILATSSEEDGVTVWRLAPDFLHALPEPPTVAPWRKVLPTFLLTANLLGAPLADWLAIAVLGAIVYLIVRFSFALILSLLARFKKDEDVRAIWHLVDTAAAPLSTVITFAVFLAVIDSSGVSIIARAMIGQVAGTAFVVAFLWLFWRVTDAGAEIAIGRMDRHERRRMKSAVLFGRRVAKLVLVAAGIIAILATIGINVTAGIAALGLGGVALALGAQKTIENLVGSVSVIADELVRVGDQCRIGDVTGTVEEIGIRSTRIRTSERSRVSIPNGNLASMQVENFAARDRFLFNPTVPLSGHLSASTLATTLNLVRERVAALDFLVGRPRVTLKSLSATGGDIDIQVYLDTQDAFDAAGYRETLLLTVLGVIEEATAQETKVPATASSG